MRNVSSTTGPVSYGETSWEAGDTPEAATGKSYNQELIYQANSVPLTSIFRHYNVRADATRPVIVCPFKSHKGGRENTGSFKYFSDTNSFYCYGCKIGNSFAHGCEFVAAMEDISRIKAAQKIIKIFSDEINLDSTSDFINQEDFSEKLDTMMEFSTLVREFHQAFNDEKSLAYIEGVCAVYDRMNNKRKLTLEALRRIVDELKEEVRLYKPCLTL